MVAPTVLGMRRVKVKAGVTVAAPTPGMRRRIDPYVIRVHVEQATLERLRALRKICEVHPGSRPVQLVIINGRTEVDLLSEVKVSGNPVLLGAVEKWLEMET